MGQGTYAALKAPGYPNIIIRPAQAKQQNDFPEFDWVSKATYVGKQKSGNLNYLVFKITTYPMRFRDYELFKVVTNEDGSSATIDLGSPVPVVAFVNEESRMPAMLKIGTDTRTYRFLPPPSTALALPEAFSKAIDAMIKKMQASPNLFHHRKRFSILNSALNNLLWPAFLFQSPTFPHVSR